MMMAQPLVSVIIPTYNRAHIIGDTIEDLLQQTYQNLEIIVVDDGSTDDTHSKLEAFGKRIRWVAQPNAGPAAARNRGIAIATGEIVAFQDSDDSWHPTKIERQVFLLQRAGQSVVCCVCNSIVQLPHCVVRSFDRAPLNPPMEEGIWLNPAEVLATRFFLFNQAVAVRRDVLARIGGFDESLRLMEDLHLALRLSLEGPWAFIREPLATRQEKGERTLGHEATTRILCENNVRIRQGILQVVEHNSDLAPLKPLMERELRRALRARRAAELQCTSVFADSVQGWLLERVEHYRMAAQRRMPWFPQMKVSAV
jgi:glycosyltransferase involved in cell wall biosynthesis